MEILTFFDTDITIYLYVFLAGFFLAIYWLDFFNQKKKKKKGVLAVTVFTYSLIIALSAHITGGLESAIFFAFFIPIIVSAYVLPPIYVVVTVIIPIVFIIIEFILIVLLPEYDISRAISDALIESILVGFMGTFAYFLSERRSDNEEKLEEAFDSLETKDLHQKEIITELIGTERMLRMNQDKLEHRNKEIQKARRSLKKALDDLDKERRLTEIERNRFESVLQSISEGIMMIDKKNRPVMINKSFEKMFGLKASELIGVEAKVYINLAKKYFKNKEEYKLWEEEAFDDDITRELIWEVNTTPPKYIERFTTPVKNLEGKLIGRIWTFNDITKETELDNMRSEFVSLASHQLRTPLSAIKWFLEMVLNEEVGKLKEKQRDILQKTYDSAERMIELVNSLLSNISEVESGNVSVDPEPTNVAELTQDMIDQLSPLIQEKGHKLNFGYDKSIPVVNIDRKLVGESILNLISNAIKYTPQKGKIEIDIKKEKDNFVISVKDNGQGISQREQSYIFSKFYRSENAVKSTIEGTGLGLYIVKAMIEYSGGEVGFDSEEGKGSTFYIKLPLKGSKKIKGGKKIE